MTNALATLQAQERAAAALRAEAARERLAQVDAAVAAMEQARVQRVEQARSIAARAFGGLAQEFGDEVARDAWSAAAPPRRKGFRVSDEKRRAAALLVELDDTNRALGLSAEASAEHMCDYQLEALGLSSETDAGALRRHIDRLKAARAETSIPE